MSQATRRILYLAVGAAALVALGGCEKAMRNMYEQPKYKPMDASALWPDGQSARPLERGVVARAGGALAGSSSGRAGAQAAPAELAAPVPMSMALLWRGRQRYDIYCAPCHSVTGDGDGMVVRRGFPAPASLHSEAMRAASDAHLYDVIGAGYGAMYPFADRIAPADRWAVVAYMRALQRSRHAAIGDVPEAERAQLLGSAK